MLELLQESLSLYVRIPFWYSNTSLPSDYPNYSNICFTSNTGLAELELISKLVLGQMVEHSKIIGSFQQMFCFTKPL